MVEEASFQDIDEAVSLLKESTFAVVVTGLNYPVEPLNHQDLTSAPARLWNFRHLRTRLCLMWDI